MSADPMPDFLPIPEADPKPWYRSRAMVGSVMVIATQVAALFGVGLDAGALTELALQFAALLGGLLAWWGRARAVQPIEPVLKGPAEALKDLIGR